MDGRNVYYDHKYGNFITLKNAAPRIGICNKITLYLRAHRLFDDAKTKKNKKVFPPDSPAERPTAAICRRRRHRRFWLNNAVSTSAFTSFDKLRGNVFFFSPRKKKHSLRKFIPFQTP